jgi:hypothetical protein
MGPLRFLPLVRPVLKLANGVPLTLNSKYGFFSHHFQSQSIITLSCQSIFYIPYASILHAHRIQYLTMPYEEGKKAQHYHYITHE